MKDYTMLLMTVAVGQVIGWILAVAGALIALAPVVFRKRLKLPVLFGIGVVITSVGILLIDTTEADSHGALVMGGMGVLLIIGGLIEEFFPTNEY